MESRILNPESDTLTLPRIYECDNTYKNTEVGNNPLMKSCKVICNERV